MKTLIVTMSGKSKRFPGLKPKWMLSHPMTNLFMGVSSITGINLDFFHKIYFVCLKEHQDEHQFLKGFNEELESINIADKSEIILLSEPTSSQSETVYRTIKEKNINGFIFIKDSDSYFECQIQNEKNQVSFLDLNDVDNINARSKSYIQLDCNGIITNIVEKKVISSTFSVGGYGFSDAKEFANTYEKLNESEYEGECYISNVIFEMILSGSKFIGLKTEKFKDWGTIDAWDEYKSQYKCLFVDIDGTLVENSSVHFPPYIGESTSLQNNINFIQKLYSKGIVKIILTTSRPEKYKSKTIKEMEDKKIPYDHIIMGLPHCQRIVINDFTKSNPYPSCSAINIPRNSDNLGDYFL